MTHTLEIVAVASTSAASLGIALALDWLCLRGLLRLMPARVAATPAAVIVPRNSLPAISPEKSH